MQIRSCFPSRCGPGPDDARHPAPTPGHGRRNNLGGRLTRRPLWRSQPPPLPVEGLAQAGLANPLLWDRGAHPR